MDIISAGLQTAAVGVGLIQTQCKDGPSFWGYDGRTLGRISLYLSISILAVDQSLAVYTYGQSEKLIGAAFLWTMTARSLTLLVIPNKSEQDQRYRQCVANSAFILGSAISFGGQLLNRGEIAPLATTLAEIGLLLSCQADVQKKQENALKLFAAAMPFYFGLGIASASPGIYTKAAIDFVFINLGLFNNFISHRNEPTSGGKTIGYIKDSAQEACSWLAKTHAVKLTKRIVYYAPAIC